MFCSHHVLEPSSVTHLHKQEWPDHKSNQTPLRSNDKMIVILFCDVNMPFGYDSNCISEETNACILPSKPCVYSHFPLTPIIGVLAPLQAKELSDAWRDGVR